MKKISQRLRSYWVEAFSLDLRALAILRIGLGIIAVVYFSKLAFDIEVFFTDSGVVPRSLLVKVLEPLDFSINLLGGSLASQSIIFVLALASAVCFLLGYKTRTANFFLWLLWLSIERRNPYIVCSVDRMMRLMLFWSLFVPVGKFWSIDALKSGSVQRTRLTTVGTMAVIIQVFIIYFFAGWEKFLSPTWQQGVGFYYSLLQVDVGTSLSRSFAEWTQVGKVINYFTPYYEVIVPLFLFVPIFQGPARLIASLFFMCFSVGVFTLFNISYFPFIGFLVWLTIMPPVFWEFLFRRLRKADIRENKEVLPRGFQKPKKLESIFVTICIVYSFFWCLSYYTPIKIAKSPAVQWFGHLFALNQHWSMFAISETEGQGWIVIPGRQKNGSEVNLLRVGEPLSWAKPVTNPPLLNFHWLCYLDYVLEDGTQNTHDLDLRPYGRHLCKTWNASHGQDEVLESLRFVYVSPPNETGQSPVLRTQLFWKCSENGPDGELSLQSTTGIN